MRNPLILGTALLCLSTTSFAQAETSGDKPEKASSSVAKAKFARARKAHAKRSSVVDNRDEAIASLKAEVDALTHRLDAEEAAQRATAQEAQTAQTIASTAQNQAAIALNQSQPVPVAAAAPVPVPPQVTGTGHGWWDNTTVGGRAFFNVSDIHQTSTDLQGHQTENAQNGTETELKRFYLILDHKFDDTFSANLTTDFRYNANGTTKDTLVFVKKAYVQAKFSPAFFVRIGESDLAWVPFVESLYGYRFVENTLIDRTKFGASTDWGVHVAGTLANGLVSYAASAIDGAGFKTLSRSSEFDRP